MIKKIILFTKTDLFKSLSAFAVMLFLAIVVIHYFNIEVLRKWVLGFGVWGVIIFVLAKISALVFSPINGTPIYLIAVVAYGPFWGFVWSLVGDTLGAIISFYLARIIGRVWVDKMFSNKEENIIQKLLNLFSTTKGIVYGHLACFAFPDILNYAAGLSKSSLKKYLIIHVPFNAIGIIGVMYISDIILLFGSKGLIWATILGVVFAVLGLFIVNKYFKIVKVVVPDDDNIRPM